MSDGLCSECFGRINGETNTCICAMSEKISELLNQFGDDWYISDVKYNYENSDRIIIQENCPVTFTSINNVIEIK